MPGLREAEPYPHRHSGGEPGVPGSEAGGRLARHGACAGKLKTKKRPGGFPNSGNLWGALLLRAEGRHAGPQRGRHRVLPSWRGTHATHSLGWHKRPETGRGRSFLEQPRLWVSALLPGAVIRLVTVADGGGLLLLLRRLQGLLDQPQHELPLGQLPAGALGLALQVGLDPLEKVLLSAPSVNQYL